MVWIIHSYRYGRYSDISKLWFFFKFLREDKEGKLFGLHKFMIVIIHISKKISLRNVTYFWHCRYLEFIRHRCLMHHVSNFIQISKIASKRDSKMIKSTMGNAKKESFPRPHFVSSLINNSCICEFLTNEVTKEHAIFAH